MVFEKGISVFFPVALETSSFGGGSGSSAVLMVGKKIVAIDNGELAVRFFKGGVYAGIDRSAARALKISVLENDDWCVLIAFNVIADVAIVLVWPDN